MYKLFSVMLTAFAISTPAHADVFGIFSSNGGPEQVVDGYDYAPTQNSVVDGSMHGYPFYSGCCDGSSSYGAGLWDGYCGSKGGGLNRHHLRHHGHIKGGYGCGNGCCSMGYGHSICGKGGCGYPEPYGLGVKSGWGRHVGHQAFGGKGQYGFGVRHGGKGCGTCDPCAPKHCRLGLFDWLHFGHGHGCDVCGDVGCSSCDGGKGGFGKGGHIEQGTIQGYNESYYGSPTGTDEESTLQPPEVLVEPTSASDRSAWRRPAPANPFARPFSY